MVRDCDLWSKDEFELLFDELAGDGRYHTLWRAVICLMYRCGLRVSEVVGNRDNPKKGLRVKDIDLESRSVRVNHGKGDRFRVVAMDLRTLSYIKDWMEIRRSEGWGDGYLFVTAKGTRMDRFHVNKRLKTLAEKAGVNKRVHPHMFRDMLAVELMEEGRTVWEIQKILGHANLNTTQVYLDKKHPKAVLDVMKAREW